MCRNMLRHMFCSSHLFSILCDKITKMYGRSPGVFDDVEHISLVQFNPSYYLDDEILF